MSDAFRAPGPVAPAVPAVPTTIIGGPAQAPLKPPRRQGPITWARDGVLFLQRIAITRWLSLERASGLAEVDMALDQSEPAARAYG